MTSKEALDFLNGLISREKHIDSERNKKIIERYHLIKKDLERLENLERQNEVLKRDLKKYQAYIKKGVEEHYEDFVSDYDLLLQENYELNKKLEILEILKKHYDKDSLVVSIGRFISFYIYNEDTDFEKVKEWLGK